MKLPSWRPGALTGPGGAKSTASFTAVSVLAASLVFAAVTSEGYRTTSTDLHDGTVWTLSTDRNAAARINARIDEIDTVIRTDVSAAQLYQDGTSVYLQTPEGFAQLNAIGTNIAANVQFAELDAGSQIGVAGRTAAVLGPDGRLWVVPSQALSGVDPLQTEPLVALGAGSRLAVSPDGVAVVLDPAADTVTTVTNRSDTFESADGQFEISDPLLFGHDLVEPGESASDFRFSAVGSTAVALLDGEVLLEGGGSSSLDGQGLVLQQPGIAADAVVVAGDDALYRVPLDGGDADVIAEAGAGSPAQPVVVGNCVYAGWESTGTVWTRCGSNDPIIHEIESERGSNWVFRVNRDQVVLEARGANPRRITDDGLVAIDNWEDFDSDQEQQDDQQTEVEPDQKEQAVCKDEPAVPEATDDVFGATPGVSLVLRVLDNDRDPNCDPIALQPLAEGAWNPEWGSIALIEQNQAFQYTPPSTAVAFSFPYTIDDGTGGEASATVSVSVSAGENEPPQMKPGRSSETIVEMFKTVSYNVLLDWEDPNGDTLLLESALVNPGDGTIIWSKDGTITYTASDTAAGPKEIPISVSDGRGGVVPGSLNISVQGEGVPIPPTARDDYVQAPAGREVTVEPLQNDTDPNNDPLVLGEYTKPDAVNISQGEKGVLRLVSDTPGTYLIPYLATDGTLNDTATVRFEVTDPNREQSPPIPVRDSVVMKVGRSLNVDVLANDFDADGDVLAVTDARLQQVGLAGIDVKVIDRRFVRVQVDQDPGQPLVIEYLVNDGRSTDQVGQLVVNVAPASGNQRPVPGNDAVRVRVNDVVTIPVLNNDTDPDGDQINILSATLDPATQPGVLWLDGRNVRYRAGSEAGTIKAKYTIDDTPERSGLNASSGFIEITVVDAPPDKNLPPVPPTLEARVFAGSSVTIPVPMAGIDPDGDSVRLVGIGKSPPPLDLPAQFGVPTARTSSIFYTANVGASGQDVFTYEVEDAFGARSVGIVRVVVINAPNHPPALVPDFIVARPGRLLQVPVLSNDSDPDGDALSLEEITPPDDLDAVINEGRVQVALPVKAGTWQLYYSATDGKSPAVTQVLTVVADPEAPLLPAVTRDDPADDGTDLELVQQPDGSYTTTLDVLANDDDPDGARSELIVDVPLGQGVDATVEPGTGKVTVVLGERPQSFVYSATDYDLNVSYAVVRVPRSPSAPGGNRPPELLDDPIVASIVEGQVGEVRLADYVFDPDGDEVTLAGETPSSAQGEATVSSGNFGSFSFTPALGLGQPTASVTVAVTDEFDNPERTVELVFQIEVIQPNQPPTVQPATVPVEQQADADPLDLVAAGAVVDPELDALTFTLIDGGADGLDVSLASDGKITATANDAPEGLSATYRYSVTDGQPDRVPVEGTFTVQVVASTKPLVVLKSISRTDIRQGEAEQVDVLTGVANPFPDTPLRVIEAELVDGSGTVTFDDRTVTFTPPDDYFGVAEVRYTVEDATQNASRHVVGSVRYTVIGRPLPPGQPRVVEVYSHTAVVQWVPADPQGSPITDYTVRWAGGTINSGGATTVTIDTLTNNTAYTFTVSAINAVGESDPSAASGEIIPDEVPPAPNQPRIVDFGDGTLSVEWDQVVPDGSPVILYHLTVSGGGTQTFPGSQLSTVWTGLKNGTEYTFSLVAENNEGRSDPSALSGPLSPAREPEAPTNVTVSDQGSPLRAIARVSWTEPANNGRPIDQYEITVVATGQTYVSTSRTIDIPDLPDGLSTTFTVRARNVVGFSVPSAPSAAFVYVTRPDTPPTPGATATGVDNQVRVSAAAVASGGATISGYYYRVNGGGARYPLSSGAGTVNVTSGFSNGVAATVQIQVCNSKSTDYCSDWSPPSASVTPYGPPVAANIGLSNSGPGSGSQAFTINWNGAPASNGRPITGVRLIVSGLFDGGVGLSGSTGFTGNWSTNYTATLIVTDSAGGTAQRSISLGVGPQPPATVTVGSSSTCPESFSGAPSNWNGGTCNRQGQGFIAAYTVLEVSCSLPRDASWVYRNWYRIVGGGPIGWYVADGTVSAPTRPLPTC